MDKILQLKNKYYQYVKNKGYNLFYYVPLDATFPVNKKDWKNEIDNIWTTNAAINFLKKDPNKLYEWAIKELEGRFNYLFNEGYLTTNSKLFEIVKPPMGRLYTWDFLSDDYPVSHSKLQISYIDRTGKRKDFIIDRKGDSKNYNYGTANCADATGYCALDANDDFKHPDTFHTPMSVKLAALRVPGAIDRGKYVAIPIQHLLDIIDAGSEYYETITDDIYKNKHIRKEGGLIKKLINNTKLLLRKKTGGIIKLLDENELPSGTYGALDNPIKLNELEYEQTDEDKLTWEGFKEMFGTDYDFWKNFENQLYLDEDIENDYARYPNGKQMFKPIKDRNQIVKNLFFLYKRSSKPTHFSDQEHNIYNNGRSNFVQKWYRDPNGDTIYTDSHIYNPTDKNNSYDSSTVIWNYLAELAHALQYGKLNEFRGIGEGGSNYNTPGYQERIAHSIIEDKLWNFIHFDFDNNTEGLTREKAFEMLKDDILKGIDTEVKWDMPFANIEGRRKFSHEIFKKGGLIKRFQLGGLNDSPYDLTNWYLPFDPRVYRGKKGTPSKEAQNNAAMWRKAKPYYDEFIKYGIDPYVALGIMGNMAMESSFDPNAYSGYYRGLILNEPKIVNYIVKSYGGYDRNHLIQFIVDGLKGRIKGDISLGYGYDLQKRFLNFLKAVRGSKDVAHIAGMWDDLYEQSDGKTRKRRLNFASYFALLLGL